MNGYFCLAFKSMSSVSTISAAEGQFETSKQLVPCEVVERDSLAEHKVFINIANEIAKFSKCRAKQVGCIIVKDRRIISSGCNGTPTGAINCCDIFDPTKMNDVSYRMKHHEFSQAMECHAEQNAILMAARYGNAIEGCTFYVSLKPCEQCLKMIASLNVKHIYYSNEYDLFKQYSPQVQVMIRELGIEIVKIDV